MKDYNAKKARIFTKAYDNFFSIENDADLKKNNISLSDHAIIFELLKEFSTLPDYNVLTSIKTVALWFRNNGFHVRFPDRENINYSIGF